MVETAGREPRTCTTIQNFSFVPIPSHLSPFLLERAEAASGRAKAGAFGPSRARQITTDHYSIPGECCILRLTKYVAFLTYVLFFYSMCR
jgi:hypothetical protein